MTYEQIIVEAGSIWFLLLVLIFAIIGLLHMRLGLHEVIEDYVHTEFSKKMLFIAINLNIVMVIYKTVYSSFLANLTQPQRRWRQQMHRDPPVMKISRQW